MMIATREHVISHRDHLDEFLKHHPLHALYGGENAFLLKDYLDALAAGGIRLSKVLNPLASDINLYPETRDSARALMARKLRLPSASLVPDAILALRGKLINDPGRLYTFFGFKR
jgi:hypothetical protein